MAGLFLWSSAQILTQAFRELREHEAGLVSAPAGHRHG